MQAKESQYLIVSSNVNTNYFLKICVFSLKSDSDELWKPVIAIILILHFLWLTCFVNVLSCLVCVCLHFLSCLIKFLRQAYTLTLNIYFSNNLTSAKKSINIDLVIRSFFSPGLSLTSGHFPVPVQTDFILVSTNSFFIILF